MGRVACGPGMAIGVGGALGVNRVAIVDGPCEVRRCTLVSRLGYPASRLHPEHTRGRASGTRYILPVIDCWDSCSALRLVL